MSHTPQERLPFWNQLGALPVEQWCSTAEEERNELDSYLVEQVDAELDVGILLGLRTVAPDPASAGSRNRLV